MTQLENAIHMMKKKFSFLRNGVNDFTRGYRDGYAKAIRDVEWLKGVVNEKEERAIEDYFNQDRAPEKIKKLKRKYGE